VDKSRTSSSATLSAVVLDLTCNRCRKPLRADTAVSFAIEVVVGERVVERLQFFDLHPACARLVGEPELNKRAKKYRRREGVSVRSGLAANLKG
jgi:hypothetical protein